MKQIKGQMSIFDFLEPEVGEWVTKHGAAIPHIMRQSMVGKKVVYPCGTQSRPDDCQVGILEKYIWNWDNKCMRSIIFTGKKQRTLFDHMNGRDIYECLSWDKYPERMAAIGRRTKEA